MSSNVPLLTQSWAAACLANSVSLDWCSTQSGRGSSSGCMISMLMRTSTTVHTTPKVKGTGRWKIDLCKLRNYSFFKLAHLVNKTHEPQSALKKMFDAASPLGDLLLLLSACRLLSLATTDFLVGNNFSSCATKAFSKLL